jgi:hypothetical protein
VAVRIFICVLIVHEMKYYDEKEVKARKGMNMRILGIMPTLLIFSACMASDGSGIDSTGAKVLTVTGSLAFDIGEYVKARSTGGGDNGSNPQPFRSVDHIWFGHTIATLNLCSNPSDNFAVRSSFEFRQYMNMFPITNIKDKIFGPYYWNGFYIREGQGIFSPLSTGPLRLDIAFGYMPYKYSVDTRDLGEYLFRTGTYPLFALGEFDRPFARLTGLRLGLTYDGGPVSAKADLLGLIEREIRPFNDISLAAVAGVNVLKVLEIGGGVDLAHCIPMNSLLTMPENDKTQCIDTVTGDTSYYSFQGTKVMVRGALDPVGMWRGRNGIIDKICGTSGGRIYAEYAIIGLKNYPSSGDADNLRGYLSVAERSPWMVGINIPAWKIFDVCALEFERFPSYFPDDYWRVVVNGLPLPSPYPTNSITGNVDSSYAPRWNWSLYLKKQIVRHFSIVGQIGRGHQRWESNPNASGLYDFEAALVKPDHFGWICSGIFSF